MATKPEPKEPRRQVFLVEDHPITREGFAQLINYQADLHVCGQAGSASRALAGIEAAHPDLIIIDISLVESNGLELIKQLKSLYPSLAMLVLSTHDEALYAERAIRAGARGYVMKQAPTAQVMAAIRATLKGEIYLSETMLSRMVHQHLHGPAKTPGSDMDLLTDRELEIFELIGHGQTTRKISAKLNLSLSTVETHRAHMKEKLRLTNAVELVRRAVEWVNQQPRKTDL